MTDQPATTERPLAVVDIDGVVADVRHRLSHLTQRPKDWHRFFAAAEHDPVHPEGLAVLERLLVDHEVVFLTGRPAHIRGATERWLRDHGLGGCRLLMREGDDRRPAARFKVLVVAELARHREIGVVIDDDEAVVASMRAAGFPAFHADWELRTAIGDDAVHTAQQVDGQT